MSDIGAKNQRENYQGFKSDDNFGSEEKREYLSQNSNYEDQQVDLDQVIFESAKKFLSSHSIHSSNYHTENEKLMEQ